MQKKYLLSLVGLWLLIAGSAFAYPTVQVQKSHSPDQIKQAALNGDPDAEYALGYMYYYGNGVTRNPELALTWIQKAASQGQPQAKKAMQLLEDSKPTRAGKVHIFGQHPMANKTVPKTIVRKTRAYTQDEQKLLDTPKNYYTIQLVGVRTGREIQAFVNHYKLQNSTKFYKTHYLGKPWYVLIYGVFKSEKSAINAVRKLPKSLQATKPWVKSFASVHNSIHAY